VLSRHTATGDQGVLERLGERHKALAAVNLPSPHKFSCTCSGAGYSIPCPHATTCSA
jgi:hypothetical protein